MNAPHRVLLGWEPLCSHPETSEPWEFWVDEHCRGCMTGLIAAAVTYPEQMCGSRSIDGYEPLKFIALRAVRSHVAEDDPLRVRAEQALLPLCEVPA